MLSLQEITTMNFHMKITFPLFIPSRLLLWLPVGLICLIVACQSAPKQDVQKSLDDFLTQRYDSIYTHPVLMAERFSQAQQKINDSAAYYRLELYRGYCLYQIGDFDEMTAINNTVLHFTRNHPDHEQLEAVCWNHRSALMIGLNERDSATTCLLKAYEALMHTSNRSELENICINLADNYRFQGDLAQSAFYYRRALWVADSLQTPRIKFGLYTGLAQVYADLHNFKLAHHYFDLAQQDPEPRIDYENYHFYNSLGNCYYFEERYDSALTCFQKAYAITKNFRQPALSALVEGNLGEIFTLMGKTDSAHHYLDKSYNYFRTDQKNFEEFIFYVGSLQAALALQENNLSKAHHFLNQPYDARHISPSYLHLHNKRFMAYYEKKKDYTKAYHYQLLMERYDDSIRNARNDNYIAEIAMRYQQDTTLLKRNIVIAQAENQLSEQRTWIMLILSLLIILSLLSILYYIYMRRKREKEYNQQLALVTRLRMENVKNRISPHYIFNVLNAIMPMIKQYPDLAQLMNLFIKVLRGNLQIPDQMATTLEEEITLVKNFLALREEIHTQHPEIIWTIDADIPLATTLIPSMAIQIPVENAVKYAFEEDDFLPDNPAKPFIKVDIKRAEKGIEIVIQDNGHGFNPGKQSHSERGTGNGLKMIYRTIDLLNRKNTNKMVIQLHTLPYKTNGQHGTTIRIFVPNRYQFDL